MWGYPWQPTGYCLFWSMLLGGLFVAYCCFWLWMDQ